MTYADDFWEQGTRVNSCLLITDETKLIPPRYIAMVEDEQGKLDIAQHIAWRLHNGKPIPEDSGIEPMCGHYFCIEPTHLIVRPKGNKAKLDEDKVRRIRKLYGARGVGGLTIAELAKTYHVSVSTIHDVITEKTWKGVE